MSFPANSLMKYAGLAGQLFISMLLTLFVGKKIDAWFRLSAPLFVWLLPLLVILGSLIKIVIETNKRKK